jgi:LPXTG-motif cell wall-anchored protein
VKGVRALVGGYVACAALAAPAALSAAEGDAGSDPVGSAGAVVAPAPTASGVEVTQAAPPASSKQTTHEVVMRDISFVPKTITIDVGDTVTWRNEDSEPHNAIAEDDTFKTATIEQGETASATIEQAGTYPYFCSIHAGMKGTVKVGSGGGSGGGGSGSSGGSGGSGSSGTGSGSAGGDFLGDPSSSPSAGSGTSGSSLGGGTGDPSSLPTTGQDDALWFALAGAWLLSVGAAIRAAASDAVR